MNDAISQDLDELSRELAAPFDPREVKFKPAVISGRRALALAYIDARVIQDRLDSVLGVGGWRDEYDCLPDGSVVCRLHLKLGEQWITKMDVGGESEQPDGGDRRKAAFSDALKRAAVKFGIGRYLYRLPAQWVEYDPQKRQFVRTPALSTSATAKGERRESPKPPVKIAAALPATGAELEKRLREKDRQLAAAGLCQAGELIRFVADAGQRAGHPAEMATWDEAAIRLAVAEAKKFTTRLQAGAAQRPGRPADQGGAEEVRGAVA